MRPGTSHFGHRARGWRTPLPPFPGFQSAFICVHLRPSLDFHLSTVNSAGSGQPPCFDNLAHSSTTSQESPLCFHNLMNPFSRSSFPLITLQIAGGCTPHFSNSFITNDSTARPKNVELFRRQNGIPYRVRDSADELRPELRKAKVPGLQAPARGAAVRSSSLRGKEVEREAPGKARSLRPGCCCGRRSRGKEVGDK